MIDLIQHNIVPVLIAIAIGLLVGWWVWRRLEPRKDARPADIVAPKRAETPEPLAAPSAEAVSPDREPEPEPLPAAAGRPDNLQTLKGVGPKLATRFNEIGITRFDQLAALTPAQAEILDGRLQQFNGRIKRDRLVEQASYLARGDLAAFQATFGNLGSGAG